MNIPPRLPIGNTGIHNTSLPIWPNPVLVFNQRYFYSRTIAPQGKSQKFHPWLYPSPSPWSKPSTQPVSKYVQELHRRSTTEAACSLEQILNKPVSVISSKKETLKLLGLKKLLQQIKKRFLNVEVNTIFSRRRGNATLQNVWSIQNLGYSQFPNVFIEYRTPKLPD